MAVEEGDNIEFTAVDIDEYTIWFAMSDDDTATTKYPDEDNAQSAEKFIIRCDKSADLIQINNTTFTDPCQITADKAHIERRDTKSVAKIKIRTNSTNTLIKVRWF